MSKYDHQNRLRRLERPEVFFCAKDFTEFIGIYKILKDFFIIRRTACCFPVMQCRSIQLSTKKPSKLRAEMADKYRRATAKLPAGITGYLDLKQFIELAVFVALTAFSFISVRIALSAVRKNYRTHGGQ